MRGKYKLYGAILGDLAGQPFEFPIMKGSYENVNIHNPASHITDDTIMTLASARSLIHFSNIEDEYKKMAKTYPEAGYGKGFKHWVTTPFGTIGDSWGNGCLMRISPFMYVENSLPLIINSVRCSHHHQISYESVMKLYNFYKYKNTIAPDQFQPVKKFKTFEVKADATVDFCINLVGQTYGVSRSIIKAIECGGDTDTNASIVGELANYRHDNLTKEDIEYVESKLDPYLLSILHEFNKRF